MNSTTSHRFLARAAAWASLVLLARPATPHAQITPEILISPWQEGPHWAETVDDLWFDLGGHAKGTDLDVDLWGWDSTGRIKLARDEADPSFVLGYRILTLSIDSDLPAINDSAWDIALVGAGRLGKVGDGWQLGAGGGLGSANDGHFSNEHALYGIAFFNASLELDEASALHLGLEYNGNRVFQPNWPLPYAAWQRRWTDQLTTVIGLPVSRLIYQPCEWFTLRAGFFIPSSVGVSGTVRLMEGLYLFAEYGGATDAYYIDGTANDRMFYHRRWVGGGIRAVTKWFDATLGGGYALEREFETGESSDSVDTVADLSEEPVLLLRVSGTF